MSKVMFVCVVGVRLYLGGAHSLKEKRSVVKSLLEKTRHKFALSMAEVGDHDLWQSSRIGFALVGNDKGFLEREMEKILDFLEQGGEAEIAAVKHEIWSFNLL